MDAYSTYHRKKHSWEIGFPENFRAIHYHTGDKLVWVELASETVGISRYQKISVPYKKLVEGVFSVEGEVDFGKESGVVLKPKLIFEEDPLFEIMVKKYIGTHLFVPVYLLEFLLDGLRKLLVFNVVNEDGSYSKILEYYHDGILMERIVLDESADAVTDDSFLVAGNFLIATKEKQNVLLLELFPYPGQ